MLFRSAWDTKKRDVAYSGRRRDGRLSNGAMGNERNLLFGDTWVISRIVCPVLFSGNVDTCSHAVLRRHRYRSAKERKYRWKYKKEIE